MTLSGQIASIINDPVYSKLLLAAVVAIVAFAATRAVALFMNRWGKRIIARLGMEPGGISPAQTKIDMMRRIINAAIYFLAAVFFMFQFPQARAVGTTFLASAGLLSIVVGLAAQGTLSNIVAGVSIAFSQPVRENDAVIYDGNWGWVEEITLMHTVIKTWDNRRLVVPNSVLNSTVIENWTIKDAWLLGIVMLYVDFTCDVEQVRKWTKEIVNTSQFSSEEKVAVVQVVDFTEKSMVLRILGKSWDSPNTWNLRCDIRERLIEKFRDAGMPLPEFRVENTGPRPRG